MRAKRFYNVYDAFEDLGLNKDQQKYVIDTCWAEDYALSAILYAINLEYEYLADKIRDKRIGFFIVNKVRKNSLTRKQMSQKYGNRG